MFLIYIYYNIGILPLCLLHYVLHTDVHKHYVHTSRSIPASPPPTPNKHQAPSLSRLWSAGGLRCSRTPRCWCWCFRKEWSRQPRVSRTQVPTVWKPSLMLTEASRLNRVTPNHCTASLRMPSCIFFFRLHFTSWAIKYSGESKPILRE